MEGVVDATLDRLDALAGRYGPPDRKRCGFETVYVGGGTPSILPRPLLARLLQGIAARLGPAPGAGREWTVEANPESLDGAALDLMVSAGVNRLSIGVQSLDDNLLERLGRRARSRDALRALDLAAESGIPRRSADLIAGLPRTGGSLASEARVLLDAGIEHISVYDLVVEEGTALAAEIAAGHFALPDEDRAADEREDLESFLAARGFRRYEVSNYAIPGAESRHNLVYWRLDSYLGAGPGAVSTLVAPGTEYSSVRPEYSVPDDLESEAFWAAAERGAALPRGSSLRIEESRDLSAYVAGGAEKAALCTAVRPKDAAFESVMMGFRSIFGLERQKFRRRHGLGLEVFIGETLDSWRAHLVPGLLPDSLALDGRGLNLENRFLEDCLAEIDRKFPDSLF